MVLVVIVLPATVLPATVLLLVVIVLVVIEAGEDRVLPALTLIAL